MLAALGHGAVVVTAPPGAGKTTRVPLALMDAPWRGAGRIVVLEPRRVAARAAAQRMSDELGTSLGGVVGLTTREDRRTSAATVVEVVTEGTLVRRLQRDPELPGVACVLLDEFHERSLDADLALALCLESRDVLRPDLRLGVLSATIDAGAVAELLGGDATIVASEGRSFPVTVEHVDGPPLAAARPHEVAAVVAAAVRDAVAHHDGDLLVFLPGVGEIERTRRDLGDLGGVDVVALHGGLPPREQDRALLEGTRRRVVLATDLAESSVTVPGVRVVVDAGLAREPRLDVRTGMTRLVTVAASRASADQRAGRAGRVADGHAVRLWPAATHAARPAWPVPEIAQGDLAGFVLTTAAWGVEPEDLRLLDQPPSPALAEARATLVQLGALVDDRVTDHGRRLADLPLHPRLGHLVLTAASWGVPRLGVELAALLAERDVLGRSRERPDADLVTRVRLLRGRGSPRGVRDGALARVRREVGRLTSAVARLDVGPGAPPGGGRFDEEELVGALVALAWPDRVGRRRGAGGDQRGRFLLSGGRGAVLPDGDPLAGEEWIAVADVDAGRVDARVHRAAAIPEAVVRVALADLVVRDEQVHWDDDLGDVVAVDRESLGAITLVERPLRRAGADVRGALLEGVRARGLEVLTWSERGRSLRQRLAFLAGAIGPDWPDTSDAVLLATLEEWLLPFVPSDVRRLGDLRRVDTTTALMALVPPDRFRRVDDLAPTHLEVPSGSRIRIDYGSPEPVLAVKLQELFGLDRTPRIADGRIALLVHLLSPAGRPLQVTRDLAGFWDGAYAQVRAEMRGRYPKHAWPEDPRSVPAHRGTKNRMRRG